uniref:C-type lectin domain-containing protein n=1 Tax=Oncorhynchus tshawytscha TaxID=74940 RepID=A0AAZ3SEE0_ONCTS
MFLIRLIISCDVVHFQWWKRPYKVAALCLGLLCVLLLAGIIGLGVHYQLQTSYNNMTKERDQLQINYSTLTKERDPLQTNRDQLQRETIRLNKKLKGRPCHEGWIKFETSCYFLSTVNKTWEESRMDCIRREAHLVIINNREEQVFINGLNGANKQIWIGLTDTIVEGTWKWVDGTPLTTTYWGDGQPNSWKETEQDCGEFVHRSTDPGDWNDDGCSVEQYCVCEK